MDVIVAIYYLFLELFLELVPLTAKYADPYFAIFSLLVQLGFGGSRATPGR